MIKACKLSVVLLSIFLLLLVSCASLSSSNSYEAITEDEARQALTTALSSAVANANTEFYKHISTSSFLPSEYQTLTDLTSIPGLSQIFSNWKTYVQDFIYSNLEAFYAFVDSCTLAIEIEDPLSLVEESNTSMTELFSYLYTTDMRSFWTTCMENLEQFYVSELLNQYTNWIVSQNLLYETQLQALESVNIKEYLANHLTELYLEKLATEEELFRTTPNAYADKTARKVFRTY